MIINADDLGLSPGCNKAILQAHQRGILSHASVMANSDYLDDALKNVIPFCPNLKLGAHLNLSYGPSFTNCPALTQKGLFAKSFPGIMLSTIMSPDTLHSIEQEFDAQLNHLKKAGVNISRIDSHHHVHMIPTIFPIVSRLAENHKIPHIRIVNESLLFTLKVSKDFSPLLNKSLLQHILLKLFYFLNGRRTKSLFFSILHSGCITAEMVKRIQQSNKNVEVMLHPGVPIIDRNIHFHNTATALHQTSKCRSIELAACMEQPINHE